MVHLAGIRGLLAIVPLSLSDIRWISVGDPHQWYPSTIRRAHKKSSSPMARSAVEVPAGVVSRSLTMRSYPWKVPWQVLFARSSVFAGLPCTPGGAARAGHRTGTCNPWGPAGGSEVPPVVDLGGVAAWVLLRLAVGPGALGIHLAAGVALDVIRPRPEEVPGEPNVPVLHRRPPTYP